MLRPFLSRLTDCISGDARKLAERIKKKGGKDLKAVNENLVDQVWGKDRPTRPNEKVCVLSVEYAGKSISEKLEQLRKDLDKKKSAGFIVCMDLHLLGCPMLDLLTVGS